MGQSLLRKERRKNQRDYIKSLSTLEQVEAAKLANKAEASKRAKLNKLVCFRNSELSKVILRLKDTTHFVTEEAMKVKEEHDCNKMFFCFNTKDNSDCLVVKYEGSEGLLDIVGDIHDITLADGSVRASNYVRLVEVLDDGVVVIKDKA